MNEDPKDESGPRENILEEDRSKGSYGHELGSSQTGQGLGAEVWEVGSKRQRGEVTKGLTGHSKDLDFIPRAIVRHWRL